MNKKIVFLTKGGPSIGLGHVRRCLAIAYEAQRQNEFDIVFSVNDEPSVLDFVRSKGFPVVNNFDYEELSPSIIVIDTKENLSGLIRTVRGTGTRVCLVDNVTPARLLCNAVIYPVEHFSGGPDWDGFTGTLYAGAKYFPLNKEFLEVSAQTVGEYFQGQGILVTMGGTDPFDLTLRVVNAILGIPNDIIKVVIGPNFSVSQVNALQKLADNSNSIQLFDRVRDMATLISSSKLIITALGTTILEAAYLGVPTIILSNFIEDLAAAKGYESIGSACFLGHYKDVDDNYISENVKSLLRNKSKLDQMSLKGEKLVDGFGAFRIVNILKSLI